MDLDLDRKQIKRCVVAFLPPPEEEDAGEEIRVVPCPAAAAEEERRRSSKRKGKRCASNGSKPAGTLVPADGEEMILVPPGKLALSKNLVDKILSLERMELPHVAGIVDDGNPNPSEADKALRRCVLDLDRDNKRHQDKLAACQAIIRRVRHGKGYAVVDNRLDFRVAVCRAEGVFLLPCHIADLIPAGFDLVSN
ncbi:uncharacterized protein LOC127755600 [Oryza glaberrima]|uniref:Uncharacterized protein n=1 Tax=Oryza glaberrima TaxID=4538 RepID=I1R367_ORYGL|nr:uncharacterized protein LOC127755600 [Oryza glaberrima]